jgi:hypothetical protein
MPRTLDPCPLYYCYLVFDYCAIPRYVGKGKYDRHKVSSRWKNHNPELTALIREFGPLPLVILIEGVDERTAFDTEKLFIKAIGRADKGSGPLLNRTDGGDGITGRVHSVVERQAMAEIAHRWQAALDDEARENRRKNFIRAANDRWAADGNEAEREHFRQMALDRWQDPDFRARQDAAMPIRIQAVRDAWADEEHRRQRIQAIADGHARRTPEEKADAAAKQLLTNMPEERSRITTEWHAGRSAEERSETLRKGWVTRKLRDPEGPYNQSPLRSVATTALWRDPEYRAKQAKRRPSGSGTYWITDGQRNRRIQMTEPLPTGWWRGRTKLPPR